ncbi:hypothetical protein CN135_20880 [Sinorhizobium meliloti]|uniref:hypothetical protein n=1 Tax=Rhizobium meliloti TaxID=382 RepID=UPI000FD7C9A2|nr:hypothetical protein [Sinorhizobium meliloti]MCO6421770.1 hypothetical protein [Sinorhizobium meliloti]MDW9632120.1 hypothetical protein [Sinorhizobium meliloti]MDX0195496.1 hypothetical protein [Sinorhizobium meliloti]MDX0256857.1 hypothetical protein [Sinorhizobium meliloti]RVL40534.1 hypothetical protein CN148_04075 [Sinorhizobium meliloti]
MSNNPGKKGKPAPWVKRSQEHRERALQEYRRANHPAYDEWCHRRTEASIQIRNEEEAAQPEFWQIGAALKAGDKRLRAWDKANPSPLSWEDYTRLEAEFDKVYVPKDFS